MRTAWGVENIGMPETKPRPPLDKIETKAC